MSDQIKEQLAYVRDTLAINIISYHIRALQEDRLRRIEIAGNLRWKSIVERMYGVRIVRHICTICGYEFGDESINYDPGFMKDFIQNLTTEQKEIHNEICRSGLFSY